MIKILVPWRVSRLEVVQDNEGDRTVLKLSWRETGEATRRTVRITPLAGSAEPRVTVLIPGCLSAEVSGSLSEWTAGEYSIEFTGEEDFGDQSVELVGLKDRFRVLSPEELLSKARIKLSSVVAGNRRIPLTCYQYLIEVQGRIVHGRNWREAGPGTLVKDLNDGWYLGHLSVRQTDHGYVMTEQFVDNPVKFEFLASCNRILTIEDRDGDGPMFCPKCSHIFWSDGWRRGESQRQHGKELISDFELEFLAEQPVKSPQALPVDQTNSRFVPSTRRRK